MLRKGQVLGGLAESRDEKGAEDEEEGALDEADLLNTDFEDRFLGEFEIENEDT